jgi:hypothetical protein
MGSGSVSNWDWIERRAWRFPTQTSGTRKARRRFFPVNERVPIAAAAAHESDPRRLRAWFEDALLSGALELGATEKPTARPGGGLTPSPTAERRERLRKKGAQHAIDLQRRRHRTFKISDLKFQMEETANANANASAIANSDANADPSPLKGVRDDSVGDFFRNL